MKPPQWSKLIFVLNAAGNLANHGLFSYAGISIVQALYNTQISFIHSNSNILENYVPKWCDFDTEVLTKSQQYVSHSTVKGFSLTT